MSKLQIWIHIWIYWFVHICSYLFLLRNKAWNDKIFIFIKKINICFCKYTFIINKIPVLFLFIYITFASNKFLFLCILFSIFCEIIRLFGEIYLFIAMQTIDENFNQKMNLFQFSPDKFVFNKTMHISKRTFIVLKINLYFFI